MSANLKTLLTTAAEMRAVGHPWESIAQEVHRRPKTCQSWPIKYRAAWEPLYREVQQRRFEQTSNECHTFLQSLLRNKDPKVKQKALETWLKFGAKAYGWQGNMVPPALAPLPSVYEAPSEYPDDRWGAQPVSAAPRSNSIVNELAEVMEVSRKEFDKLRAKQGLPKSTEQEFLAEWDKLLDRCDIPALMELDPDGEPLPPQPSASSGSPVVRATILLVVGTILAILGNSMSGNDGPSIMSSRALAASGDQHGGGVFEVAFHGVAERSPDRPVQHAMVEGERQVHQIGGLDLPLVIVDGALDDLAHAHDADFGMVDDRRRNQSAHAADRGDGERAATQVLAASPAGLPFGSESLGLAGNGEQVFLVRIANNGDNQTTRRRDRDADVVMIVQDDFAGLLVERTVDERNFLECLGNGLYKERQIRELDADAGTSIAHADTQANQFGDIAFIDI